ncbi:hypothetical protein Scep_015236 [Stephania cephalantha]|uniref:Uncharacterized protein n=1 Tax=Stephania cephalantha TaxID=152367 RepID=A0AAP0J485_9MAGN
MRSGNHGFRGSKWRGKKRRKNNEAKGCPQREFSEGTIKSSENGIERSNKRSLSLNADLDSEGDLQEGELGELGVSQSDGDDADFNPDTQSEDED